ncbi:MAG: hypothetical protein ACRC92_26200 [Peptostreptococcaceae bacterium]
MQNNYLISGEKLLELGMSQSDLNAIRDCIVLSAQTMGCVESMIVKYLGGGCENEYLRNETIEKIYQPEFMDEIRNIYCTTVDIDGLSEIIGYDLGQPFLEDAFSGEEDEE